MLIYSWGLGNKTNNQAKALSLLKGCHLALLSGHIAGLHIFGDSQVIIEMLLHGRTSKNVKLNPCLERIRMNLVKFNSYKLFHILRNQNEEVSDVANKLSGTAIWLPVFLGPRNGPPSCTLIKWLSFITWATPLSLLGSESE